MKFVSHIIAITILLLITGCASTTPRAKVNFDKNENIDTSSYKTFAWLKPSKILEAPADFNSVMKVRLDSAIEAAFTAKGYQLVEDAERADFTVSYTVGDREKVKVDSFPNLYRTGFIWGHGYYGIHSRWELGSETKMRSYTEGKLAIDVFDVKTKQPAWHGWGTKRITNADKNDPATAVKSVVEQVVNQFN